MKYYRLINITAMWLISKRKFIYIIATVICLIIFLHPNKNGRGSYDYIEKEDILDNLHYETAENFSSNAVGDCEYREILFDDSTLSPSMKDGDLVEGHGIKEGGEYSPLECKPKFSTAIIVPYRDRAEQLHSFLIYMHMFLRRQLIHYRIFIVEQVDSRPFNRAKLMNIGAVAAMRAGYPCLVLHDVDLLPLRAANLYACTKGPRHLSSIIDKLRFVLPYLEIFGGVTAITARQYKETNGMSNEYFGWGGEDDDLQSRLDASGLKRCRFGPDVSRYHMMHHRPQPRVSSSKTRELLNHAKERMKLDGLSSLQYTEVAKVVNFHDTPDETFIPEDNYKHKTTQTDVVAENQEILTQLKEKFNDPSTSTGMKTIILTIAPKSWSEYRLAKEFATSRRQAKNTKQLVEHFVSGQRLPAETEDLDL